MFVDAAEPKVLLPGLVGILHEDSSSKGRDTLQMSALLKERKSLKVLYSLLTYDVLLISSVSCLITEIIGRLNGMEATPKRTTLYVGWVFGEVFVSVVVF